MSEEGKNRGVGGSGGDPPPPVYGTFQGVPTNYPPPPPAFGFPQPVPPPGAAADPSAPPPSYFAQGYQTVPGAVNRESMFFLFLHICGDIL